MPTPTLGELLLALRRKIAERSAETRLHDALSVSQFEVLWFVSLSGSTTMDAIATHLGIKPPSVTALIGTLEKKGFIRRARDPKDRRVMNVTLSPAAKRQLASFKKRKDEAFESLLAKLSAKDKKELTRLIALLIED